MFGQVGNWAVDGSRLLVSPKASGALPSPHSSLCLTHKPYTILLPVLGVSLVCVPSVSHPQTAQR